jgi:hypothetical protein
MNRKNHSNYKLNKKAQIQSGEAVVVVIIVIIMIVIGIVYMTKNKMSNLTEDAKELNDVRSMEVALIASNLNELKCSEYSTMVKTCFDYQRLKAFKNVIEQNDRETQEYYYNLFGNSKIDIQLIATASENIALYDYNDSANKSSSPVFIPTIVLNPMTKESYFAILEVRTYS